MRTMYVPGSAIHVHSSYITWTSSHSAQIVLLVFRNQGVPGPTSESSPRAPAQMGRRETEREGGRRAAGGRQAWEVEPATFVLAPRPGRVRL
jgi:hypothetical protein